MSKFAAFVPESALQVLSDSGFAGTNLVWTRARPPFIDCVEFQLRSDKVAYCVNLGVHLDFLPSPSGECRAVESQADCEIKLRLSIKEGTDQWWDIDRGSDQEVLDCLRDRGFQFFNRFSELPGPLSALTPKSIDGKESKNLLPGMTRVRRVLLMSRIYKHLGDTDKTLQWARLGEQIAGMAVGPKVAFQNIIRELET